MKNRLIICLLVLSFAVALVTPTYAASAFDDITDPSVENAVEVLRMMGAIQGTGEGKFLPEKTLTRAEFTKMAILAMSSELDLSKYSNITIFPDVTSSHWGFKYINTAAKMGIIYGLPSGSFAPDKDISLAEAVTILLRLIGYTDDEIGGVWPYGQENVAKSIGVLDNISYSSVSGNIKRGEAAKLFVNSMMAAGKSDKSAFSVSGKVVLKSVDAANNKIIVSELGSVPTLRPLENSSLVGKAGYVLYRSGKAAGFIPVGAVNSLHETAVVIGSSGDASALTALAGRTDYSIYKNGCKITADKLKKNDIVTYNVSDNKMTVCDTKIVVYYQSCEGSPSSPSTIVALGSGSEGISFDVLPSAMASISKYKPGQSVSLYLTANGDIAAVGSGSYSGAQNNGVFVVDNMGNADLICGNTVMDLNIPVNNERLNGKTVRISSANSNGVKFAEFKENAGGTLRLEQNKLGSKKIAANPLVFLNGEQVGLDNLGVNSIIYARENANGEIDIIAAYDAYGGNLIAGIAEVSAEPSYDEFDSKEYYMNIRGTKYPQGLSMETSLHEEGFRGYVVVSNNGKLLTNARKLSSFGSVEKDAFVDSKLVYTSRATYGINSEVSCINTDTNQWTSLEDALVYGRTFKLYGTESSVFVIEYYY